MKLEHNSKLFAGVFKTLGSGFALASKQVLVILAIGSFLILTCGCEEENKQSVWSQVSNLGQEKNQLQKQVEQLQSENKELNQQVETLAALNPQLRLKAIPALSRIQLHQRCGLYDKDKDGKKEKLIVYVQPYDEAGDTTKIAGQVNVRLWDLNAEKDKALLKEWEIESEKLNKSWAGSLFTYYYRLVFDVSDVPIGNESELTVKVSFTDYVTGKVFHKQIAIEP